MTTTGHWVPTNRPTAIDRPRPNFPTRRVVPLPAVVGSVGPHSGVPPHWPTVAVDTTWVAFAEGPSRRLRTTFDPFRTC
eukprot:scaffold14007_cov143-Amphora_coffeaeformis.AAC.3